LNSVTIPPGVTSIGNDAFSGCVSLGSGVSIPSSVTSIGSGAFQNDSGLTDVYVNATIPPTLGASAFTGCAAGLKIHVPSVPLVAIYQAKPGWIDYLSKIVSP